MDNTMTLLGNIIWLVCGGLLTSLLYILGGSLLCCTILGIPLGVAAFRLGIANLTPFGRRVLLRPGADGPAVLVANVLWLLCFGWGIALCHLAAAAGLCLTVVGIPWGIQHIKLIPLSLLPLGKTCVLLDVGADPFSA